jgi:hypothetical protein
MLNALIDNVAVVVENVFCRIEDPQLKFSFGYCIPRITMRPCNDKYEFKNIDSKSLRKYKEISIEKLNFFSNACSKSYKSTKVLLDFDEMCPENPD